MSESAKVKSTKGAKSEDKKTKAAPVEATPVPVVAQVEAKPEKKSKSTKSSQVESVVVPVVAAVVAPVVAAVVAPVVAPVVEKKTKKSASTKATPVEVAPVEVAAPEAKPVKKSVKGGKPVKGKAVKVAKGGKGAKVVAEVADDPKKRYFHCVYKNAEGEVVRAGRYSGKKPKQAARKALSRVVDKNVLPIGQSITFLIKECTRGRKKKAYSYTGSRILLDKPVTVDIKKKDGTPAKLVYKHDNVVKKVALTECADLLNIEFNDDEEQQAEEAAPVKVKKVSKGGAKATSTKVSKAKVEAAPVVAPVVVAPVETKATKATKAKAK
jgi:hypothetical protein